VVGVL
jgi:hypothetical protein